jgi:hypothetical protein
VTTLRRVEGVAEKVGEIATERAKAEKQKAAQDDQQKTVHWPATYWK